MAPDRTSLQTDRFRQSLRVVPVRNAGVRILSGERPGEVRVEVTLRYGRLGSLWRGLFAARGKRQYILEGVGREVYEDIDGQRNFEQLIDRFAARHRLSFLEARALLAQYYQRLTKSGLIVGTLPSDASPS